MLTSSVSDAYSAFGSPTYHYLQPRFWITSGLPAIRELSFG